MSRFLAKGLRVANSSQNILGIWSKTGKMEVTTKQIAQHFQEYYPALYNLPEQKNTSSTQVDG